MRAPPCARPLFGLAIGALLFALLGAAPPQTAAAQGFRETVFRSEFGELPSGALTVDTPVDAEVGTVVATAAVATIDDQDGADGEALVVSGAGAAALRFSSYPDELPQALNSQRYELVVKAKVVAPVANVAGASLSLATVGDTAFEMVSFGADGKLARDGASLALAYTAGSPVEVEARIDLKNRKMSLKLKADGSSLVLTGIALPVAFSPDSVGQLLFAAEGAAGRYAVDDVEVKVEKEEKADPAKIELGEPTYEIISENGVSFVVLVIKIDSTGGLARDVFLTIELDDDTLDLLDLSFIAGIGYIKERGNGKIVIGIGENNRFRSGKFELKFKFKVKTERGDDDDDDGDDDGDDDDGDDDGDGSSLRVQIKYTLRYRDSNGDNERAPAPLIIIVPVVVVVLPPPTAVPTSTLPISLTLPLVRLSIERIDVRFRGRWESGGGLRIYGLPLTEPFAISGGVIVQYFERARFEYHPENEGTPYVVLLGLLGRELGYAEPPAAPPTDDDDLAWYFVATGHTITPRLRAYWRDRGGLLVFGYPIGVATMDSTGLVVQYFERARLEYHPGFAGTENEVLLGLLGEELLIRNGGEVELDD
jgi:hypothetical protein